MSQPHEPASNPDNPVGPTSALVDEGWGHLRLQRPLAAWASWQRALRENPGDEAARHALERLENAPELPAAARAQYRFQAPADAASNPGRRERWDARLRGQGLDDLNAATEAFAGLVADAPDDPEARLNLALCHAWLGRNAEAVADLERAVTLLAPVDPGRAADAWTLAEVLRFGAGAETLADDFRYAWTVTWSEGEGPPAGLFESWPNLLPVSLPSETGGDAPRPDDARVYEWLDRPVKPAATGSDPAAFRAADLPRVVASVVRTPRVLRLSTPDPSGFAVLSDPPFARLAQALNGARRERAPLPLAWADAAVVTFKLPAGLDDAAKAALSRAVVEHYYEDLWIHLPRLGLDNRTPLSAAEAAARGDAVARAKLAGVIRFREQLGTRPTHAALYQGYPFDRLRRRLGLIDPADASAALDADDLSCAGAKELDGLDPASLDGPRLVDAFVSASSLRGDARTARFAAELAGRDPKLFASLDPSTVFAPLVREALREGEPDRALAWLDRAQEVAGGPHLQTFAVWSAEVNARTGRPQAALDIYQELLERSGATAALALDGAETLLDNGYADHALPLLLEARSRGLASGDRGVVETSDLLLKRGGYGAG